MSRRFIYKLVTRGEWNAAKACGVYRGSEHDRRDGFIHFSTAAQLAETARKYFTGVPDLVLLSVDVSSFERKAETPHPVPLPVGEGQGEGNCPLRWEPSRGGDLFPHLYADLPVSAVRSETAVPPGEDGAPVLPAGFAQ